MKTYMPAVIASIITGIWLFGFHGKQQPIDDQPITRTITLQPKRPVLSLEAGEAPFGRGMYVPGSLSTVEVTNNSERDVIIKLINTDNGRSVRVRNFYIPRDGIYKAEQLPEGSYIVVYAYGIDWNRDKKCFNRNPSFQMAEKLIEIRKTVKEVDGPNGKSSPYKLW